MIYSFIYWTERSTALLCASQRSFYMFCVCVSMCTGTSVSATDRLDCRPKCNSKGVSVMGLLSFRRYIVLPFHLRPAKVYTTHPYNRWFVYFSSFLLFLKKVCGQTNETNDKKTKKNFCLFTFHSECDTQSVPAGTSHVTRRSWQREMS